VASPPCCRCSPVFWPTPVAGTRPLTRQSQRTKPAIKINTLEICSLCGGTGKVQPTSLIVDDLERDLKYIINSGNKSKLHLYVNPYIYAFLKHGLPSLQMRWFFEYNKWIRLHKDDFYGINEYKFVDGDGDEIRIK